MKKNKYCLIFIISLNIIAGIFFGCSDSGNKVVLKRAEDLMETYPDSSLQILNSIEKTYLSSKEEKARYALLMSMALDKNHIDTTTFNVLQPAIDYYLSKGTADEKMRTYYYQGCIFNNQGKFERALDSFMKAVHNSNGCSDSLLLGRSHVFQGCLFYDFYDFKSYMDEYQKASEIFKRLHLKDREFECLLNILNGAVIMKDRNRADSIARLLDSFEQIDDMQKNKLQTYMLSYITTFGTKDEIRKYLNSQEGTDQPTISDILNLASAYNAVGDNQYALQLLNYVECCGEKYDTLKLKSINVSVFENIENYKKAFETYKEFTQLSDSIDLSRFEQKILSISDRYQFELKAEREAKRRNTIIYLCLCGLIVFAGVIMILVLLVKNQRTKKELALEKANNITLENHKLQSEKELALERAKLAESDNEKLKIQKELALEQSKNVELENRTLKSEQERMIAENKNLQLERDKKTLEAENLANRVEALEEESESLRTLLNTPEDLPQEVRDAIKTRVEMLNSLLASYITANNKLETPYEVWVKELTANTEKFMDSNRLAFTASHPNFIKYFEDHDLTISEINYVCLYALGLKGKEVGNYMKKRSHVNISSAIRKKLGIDKHETNIGIYVRKLLRSV